MPRLLFLVIVSGLCCSSGVVAQQGPPRPPEFASPEVNPAEGSIAFRLFAPQADAVRVSSSDLPNANPFGPGLEMMKDGRGVWEATIGPVPPGTYRYLFNIDGVQAVDPCNTHTSEANSVVWSLVTVPGSDVSDLRDVPHGAVGEVIYHSKSLDRFRRAHVYTPPGYDRGTDPLPVLYLLHGATDGDDSWSTVGRAGLVLDNLIADGQAVPMIVVMPHGHTGAFSFGPGGNLQQQMEEFARDFTNDLRPQIEARYRVSSERRHRAIAGLSMGGAQTLDIAIANLGEYGYVGVFSSGVFGINGTGFGGGGGPTWQERHQAALDDAALKEGLELVWFATGREDFLLETTRETVKVLRDKGFEVTYEETDGGHTWINWREHYLPAFARLLFR